GDFPGGLGGIALRVVEIGGNGDDGFRDGLAEASFGVGFQLGEHHRRNFLGAVNPRFATNFHFDVGVAVGGLDDLVGSVLLGVGELVVLASDEALGGENRVAGVGDGLALGGLADEAFPVLGKGHHGGSGAGAFRVFEDHRLPAFHHGHAGVGGAEVDS